jgi:hypothetical protein
VEATAAESIGPVDEAEQSLVSGLEATFSSATERFAAAVEAGKGATDDTIDHLLKNDGIKGGEIKGCHDADTFADELVTKGNGEIVGSTPHPDRADIVRHEYRLYQRNSDGTFKLVGGRKVLSTSADPKVKTVIKDLAANKDLWKDLTNKAADDAIKRKALPGGGGAWQGSAGGALELGGFFRDDVIKTMFLVF